jgi:hypothetical protein
VKLRAGNLELGEVPDGSVPLAMVGAVRVMLPDGEIAQLVIITQDTLSLTDALGLVTLQDEQFRHALRLSIGIDRTSG